MKKIREQWIVRIPFSICASFPLSACLKNYWQEVWSLLVLLQFSMRVLHVSLRLLLALKLGCVATSDIVSNHVVVCIVGSSELRTCAAVSL